jgi:uncharacterized protein (DUF2267 family)
MPIMPMPIAYRHATKDWQALLDDLREEFGWGSENVAYTLMVFRRRLTPVQGLAFATLLPAVPRAIFVTGWKVDEPPVPFVSREDMTREAQAVRPHHAWTPDHAILAVARALRRHVNQEDLDRLLASFPEGAVDFWALPPGEVVTRRFV